jgi:hypothetical protein
MTAIGLIASFGIVLALEGAAPDPAPAPKDEILGVWKGASVCTKIEGNEYCHDETVVYNVVDVPGRPDTVTLKAARIVNDRLEPMYELFFTYRPEKSEWSSEFTRPSFRGVWSYAVHGDVMTGRATLLPSEKVVRNVSVKRVPKDEAIAH